MNFEKAVLAATVAVDTFFLIGGLLTAYLGTSGWKKAVDSGPLDIVKAYFLFILNRYARLTPVLAFGIWAIVSFVPIFGNGPLCDIATSFNVYCYENWWIALLYGGGFKDRFYYLLIILPAKVYKIVLTILRQINLFKILKKAKADQICIPWIWYLQVEFWRYGKKPNGVRKPETN